MMMKKEIVERMSKAIFIIEEIKRKEFQKIILFMSLIKIKMRVMEDILRITKNIVMFKLLKILFLLLL